MFPTRQDLPILWCNVQYYDSDASAAAEAKQCVDELYALLD